ncbi:NAD(P)-dependent dehydrogenase, short-chain alcohol dehydrogenase family [Marinospirillum celere]|uniref:NAD(P)-dependent dehydrogenase, short-chain alcohol dehydrogenase family n=1 Tax=Marinospirillum celere TaxID=1122252 RepID=A0A1I1DXH5_9GAMM|nr:SDR family NAD(P)-dependent oxidoreductase [Marinospirillum celere]SFB79645.1 NAD(P)-dependent dehydrogenase, short-chain alcohol dehydrogenase family [Marinospirillum celere]
MQALIAGAGQGIGLALTKRLLSDERWTRIYALYRSSSQGLSDLVVGDSRLQLLRVDLSSDDDLQALPQQLEVPIHWIINTTGLLHSKALNLAPEKSLEQLDRHSLITSFQTNAINHLLLLKQLQPLLNKKGELKLASLSARVASIGDNRLGGWYGYRASKAALNQLLHTLAIEMRRFNPSSVCVALHPGTTATDLSKPFQKNVPAGQLFSADQSAAYLLAVLDQLKSEATGGFFAWDGQPIPW